MHIKDYGFDYDINYYENIGTPARITAVHKGRFAIVSDFGDGYAQLKGKEYYYGNEVFPTVGDFVLIDHNSSGDSRIIKTLERRTYFSRRNRLLLPILTMSLLCSRSTTTLTPSGWNAI